MKASTLVGILFGLIAIFGAFLWEGGTINSLFMIPPMLIVLGGTFAAGLAGSSWDVMKQMPKLFKIAFFPKKYDINKILEQTLKFAVVARKEGILSLEPYMKKVEHPYMAKLFRVCIDGADPETLQQIYESEVNSITERHSIYISLFNKLGGYSPTMGIIGTVMGLISTLAAAGGDPNVLIHHIAAAFIATMWGILMANIIWLPVADKLQNLHNEEMYLLSIILDGVKSVQLGETPSVIQSKLAGVFPLEKQGGFIKRKSDFGIKDASEVQPAPPSPAK